MCQILWSLEELWQVVDEYQDRWLLQIRVQRCLQKYKKEVQTSNTKLWFMNKQSRNCTVEHFLKVFDDSIWSQYRISWQSKSEFWMSKEDHECLIFSKLPCGTSTIHCTWSEWMLLSSSHEANSSHSVLFLNFRRCQKHEKEKSH